MKRKIEKIMQKVRQREMSVIDGTQEVLNLSNVVGSTVNVDEKAHYEALKECCQKLLKTVDEGKVPQKEIIGLRILFGK